MAMSLRWLSAIPSLVAALGAAALAIALLPARGFGGASSLRLVVVALMTLSAVWFAIAAFSPRLARFNAIGLVNLILILSGAEMVLRVMVDRLPISLVQMLPAASRGPILRDRGLFTRDALQGSGLLYSWRPNLVIGAQKWVAVDSNGYRNASVPAAADVVLLGDSVTVAQWVREDMAALLQLRGLSALNLGFSGYGPDQERDAYRKYVVQAGVAHRVVVVNFCGCNDVENAQVYRRVAARGGSWENYLARENTHTAFPFAFTPPWIVSILFNTPGAAKQAWRDRQSIGPTLMLSLRRGTVDATGWPLGREVAQGEVADWKPALAALEDIATLARSAGAVPIFAYYPNLTQLYLDGLASHPVLHDAAAHDWADATARLRQLADDVGARFFDYTPHLQRAISDRLVVATEGDYHPNQEGVLVMVEAILPLLDPRRAKVRFAPQRLTHLSAQR
jgi:hypothetical protein